MNLQITTIFDFPFLSLFVSLSLNVNVKFTFYNGGNSKRQNLSKS